MEEFVILNHNEKCKEYYKNNKESVLERKKKWYYANQETIKKKKREAYYKERDSHLEYNRQYQSDNKLTAKYRFTKAKAAAKHRKLNWSVSLEEYQILLNQPCTYCDNSLYLETGIGLDRKDNSRGYEIDNVLPCCGSCNQIRGNHLSVDEMKIAMQAVLNYRRINNYVTPEKIS